VTHCANNVTGAIYNNKFESQETPTRTRTVSVNCMQCLSFGEAMTETEKSSDLGKISAVTVRLGVG